MSVQDKNINSLALDPSVDSFVQERGNIGIIRASSGKKEWIVSLQGNRLVAQKRGFWTWILTLLFPSHYQIDLIANRLKKIDSKEHKELNHKVNEILFSNQLQNPKNNQIKELYQKIQHRSPPVLELQRRLFIRLFYKFDQNIESFSSLWQSYLLLPLREATTDDFPRLLQREFQELPIDKDHLNRLEDTLSEFAASIQMLSDDDQKTIAAALSVSKKICKKSDIRKEIANLALCHLSIDLAPPSINRIPFTTSVVTAIEARKLWPEHKNTPNGEFIFETALKFIRHQDPSSLETKLSEIKKALLLDSEYYRAQLEKLDTLSLDEFDESIRTHMKQLIEQNFPTLRIGNDLLNQKVDLSLCSPQDLKSAEEAFFTGLRSSSFQALCQNNLLMSFPKSVERSKVSQSRNFSGYQTTIPSQFAIDYHEGRFTPLELVDVNGASRSFNTSESFTEESIPELYKTLESMIPEKMGPLILELMTQTPQNYIANTWIEFLQNILPDPASHFLFFSSIGNKSKVLLKKVNGNQFVIEHQIFPTPLLTQKNNAQQNPFALRLWIGADQNGNPILEKSSFEPWVEQPAQEPAPLEPISEPPAEPVPDAIAPIAAPHPKRTKGLSLSTRFFFFPFLMIPT